MPCDLVTSVSDGDNGPDVRGEPLVRGFPFHPAAWRVDKFNRPRLVVRCKSPIWEVVVVLEGSIFDCDFCNRIMLDYLTYGVRYFVGTCGFVLDSFNVESGTQKRGEIRVVGFGFPRDSPSNML